MKLFRLDGHPEARRRCAEFAMRAPEGWGATFAPYEQLRSGEQNAAYWSWVHEVCDAGVQDENGDAFTAGKLHSRLKRMHLGKFIRIMPNGDTEELEATTTRLTKREFSDYMTRCQAWIAEVTA